MKVIFHSRILLRSAIEATLALSLASCDSPEIRSYSIPKEVAGSRISPTERSLVSASCPNWKVPEGWKEGKASTVRLGSYLVEDDNGSTLDVSITSFPGDMGGLLANVNRWIGQIGLDAVGEAEVGKFANEYSFAGHAGHLVKAKNKGKALTAAMVFVDGRSWFFKLSGDASLAEREQANFEGLLKSVRFGDAHEENEE